MTNKTTQERLDRFQEYLKDKLSNKINSMNYNPYTIKVPGTLMGPNEEAIPYFEEEQEYNKIKSSLESLSSSESEEVLKMSQNLSELASKYVPMVELNNLCRKYYYKFFEAVYPIANSAKSQETFDEGLEALTRVSEIKVTEESIPSLAGYVDLLVNHYTGSLTKKEIQHTYSLYGRLLEHFEEMSLLGIFD
jgi:hypothetical protein